MAVHAERVLRMRRSDYRRMNNRGEEACQPLKAPGCMCASADQDGTRAPALSRPAAEQAAGPHVRNPQSLSDPSVAVERRTAHDEETRKAPR